MGINLKNIIGKFYVDIADGKICKVIGSFPNNTVILQPIKVISESTQLGMKYKTRKDGSILRSSSLNYFDEDFRPVEQKDLGYEDGMYAQKD